MQEVPENCVGTICCKLAGLLSSRFPECLQSGLSRLLVTTVTVQASAISKGRLQHDSSWNRAVYFWWPGQLHCRPNITLFASLPCYQHRLRGRLLGCRTRSLGPVSMRSLRSIHRPGTGRWYRHAPWYQLADAASCMVQVNHDMGSCMQTGKQRLSLAQLQHLTL